MNHQPYFVLTPGGDDLHAKASRIALRAYIMAIQVERQSYARDLTLWVDIETGLFIRREQERIKSESGDC